MYHRVTSEESRLKLASENRKCRAGFLEFNTAAIAVYHMKLKIPFKLPTVVLQSSLIALIMWKTGVALLKVNGFVALVEIRMHRNSPVS